MQLVFTKGTGKYDRLEVLRAGHAPARIDCPKQGIVPHEMVHFAVEGTLARRGFLGRVAQGEPLDPRMAAEDASDAVERLVETLQADGWAGWSGASDDLLALYAVTCRARGCSALPLDGDDIVAVREQLLALTARWSATPVGGALALEFDAHAVARPRATGQAA